MATVNTYSVNLRVLACFEKSRSIRGKANSIATHYHSFDADSGRLIDVDEDELDVDLFPKPLDGR